ncbi:GNAT family N-acetyltransferase [Streptomyces sp. NPDC048057]|uniref:GNAT family N-acetyltransferase n=1 Tax=Streptomyces sp. NPDC048057 TaxID=3155628 RepID=UPI0033DE1E0C
MGRSRACRPSTGPVRPRLALRELQPDDVNGVFAIYGSPEATLHVSFEPRSREQVGAIVARSIASASADPRSEYALGVVEKEGGGLVGFGRLAADPHQQRGATFGFALHPDVWGRGRIGEHVHKGGRWRDSVVHAVLDREWERAVQGR